MQGSRMTLEMARVCRARSGILYRAISEFRSLTLLCFSSSSSSSTTDRLMFHLRPWLVARVGIFNGVFR